MKAIVFFFLVWTVTESVGQTTLIGKVINVIDGNTVEVTTVDKPQRLVFVGIDCPEMGQEQYCGVRR